MEEGKRNTRSAKTASYTVVSRSPVSRMGKYVTVVVLVVAGCFAAGIGGGLIGSKLANTNSLSHTTASDGNAIVSQSEADIANVASKVGPSVVAINTQGQTQSFYGTQTEEGAGSGIVISSDGYILTNKHVIANSTQVSVTTSDGTEYDNVTVVGTDPLNDLAFLKIKGASGLKPATFGDSSTVKIGQNVVAIGNALGQYQNTVTSGIISGTGRSVTASEGDSSSDSSTETLTDLIQTDAAINPGNSGGPLVNLSGQVVGMDTAVAEDAQSIGFAIPINSTKGIIKTLLATGKVTKAYLGVNYVAITPALAKQYSLPVKQGAYVVSDSGSAIVSGSPADKAGIKDKDIITKVGSQTVGPDGSVSSLLSQYTVNDTVPLTIIRDGKTITVNVTLAAYTASS